MTPWLVVRSGWPGTLLRVPMELALRLCTVPMAVAWAGLCTVAVVGAGVGVAAVAPADHPATGDGRPLRLIDFGRDEVADICGALALGASLLRRLGLGAESTRLEALFDVVEDRLRTASGGDVPPDRRDSYSESEETTSGPVPVPVPVPASPSPAGS